MTWAIEPHPDYGEGVYSEPEIRDAVEGLAFYSMSQMARDLTAALRPYDSIDRELAFWHWSQRTGRDYNEFYDTWLGMPTEAL